MSLEEQARQQLQNTLDTTKFDWLGQRYVGKVRDNYSRDGIRILVCSDRLSCFDRVVTTVPFKGQVLSQLAVWWFERTKNIAPNHIIDVPDPNVMVARECEVAPIEVIIRSYLTGSAWRDYEAGKAISGIKLPDGLRPSQRLPELIVTPSTKAAMGHHDMPISEQEIADSKIVDPGIWQTMKKYALALFRLGQKEAEQRGLIMVDTKYEFGVLNGEVILVDEIHTLDSSRYWVASTYQNRFERGLPPEMLDKEPVRQWLLSQDFKGDGAIPFFSDDYRVSLSGHYVDAYERICGENFFPETGDATQRIANNLKRRFSI